MIHLLLQKNLKEFVQINIRIGENNGYRKNKKGIKYGKWR